MLLTKAATDWLNTKPVFYNEKTGAISYSMNEVIDYSDFSFSPEGLRNYLKFGYSVFGQTMVENVKFLCPNSAIEQKENAELVITHCEDPAEKLWNPGKVNGAEVFDELTGAAKEWAAKIQNSGIVLPLSGGLDSRLLAYAAKGYDNVHCYSYGLSARQTDSFETVKASQVAKSCGHSWECVELDEFLKEDYLDKWYCLYGPSVHLHGMYQMEFYEKIIAKEGQSNLHMLSGIIGDGWAGTVRIPEIKSLDDLAYLGYTHGMSVDENVCLLPKETCAQEEFYETNKDKLKEENWRIVYAMRFKMMLLHYLLTTPNSLGMKSWSPFIEPEHAMNILNLDWSLKENRKWENEAFDKLNLNIGWEKDKCDYNMVLDIETLRKNPVKPLDVKLLGEVIRSDFVEEVNRRVTSHPLRSLPAKPRTAANLYNKGVKWYNRKVDEALIAYEILSPVERVLRNASR